MTRLTRRHFVATGLAAALPQQSEDGIVNLFVGNLPGACHGPTIPKPVGGERGQLRGGRDL